MPLPEVERCLLDGRIETMTVVINIDFFFIFYKLRVMIEEESTQDNCIGSILSAIVEAIPSGTLKT